MRRFLASLALFWAPVLVLLAVMELFLAVSGEMAPVARIDAPTPVSNDLALGDTAAFLQSAGNLTIPEPATINGFYVNQIGTANGVAPFGARIFFVADNPTVNDERVSSHEVGHILGLHHDLEDDGHLMFSGTNGTQLTDDEHNNGKN